MTVDQAAMQSKNAQDQSKTYKIKVDGQDLELTENEVIELAQKGKDYTKKMQALADEKKSLREVEERTAGLKAIVDEMEADPALKTTLNKVYSDYKSGKISKSSETQDRNLKKLDRLIEETTDPGQREQLRDIREIIKEEAPNEDIKYLKDTISKLENELNVVKNTTLLGHAERVNAQIEKLSEKFGADLVGKYEKDIRATALKYPNQSVSKILYHLADDAEIETAISTITKKKEKDDIDRKKKHSSPSGDSSSFVAKTELKRDNRGRVTTDSLWQRVRERLGKA